MFIVGTATIGRNRDDTTVLKSNQLYKDYSIFVRTYETRCYRRRSSPFRPVDIVTCQLLRSHQGDNAIGTRVMAGFPRSEPHNTRLVKKKSNHSYLQKSRLIVRSLSTLHSGLHLTRTTLFSFRERVLAIVASSVV